MKFIILLVLLISNVHSEEFEDSRYLLDSAYSSNSFEIGPVLENNKQYQFQEGTLVLRENESQELIFFKFRFYLPHKLVRKNLIVLTPNIAGLTILEKRLAHTLSSNGHPVLVPFDREEKLAFDHETAIKMERIVRRAMAGTFHMINNIKSQFPAINTEQMGVVGASLGGIRSSILFGLDSRFKAAFISVAGADIPSLYGATQLEQLVTFREQHMLALNLTKIEDYVSYLRHFIYLEPSLIVKNPNLKGVAMVIAEKDTAVPTKNQWELFRVIKNQGVHPKTYILNSGHVRGAAELIVREKTVLEWLSLNLRQNLDN
ncbi:MAG: hypothetical protein OHK0056_26020 [Bacteriovoracaceae bacterium]